LSKLLEVTVEFLLFQPLGSSQLGLQEEKKTKRRQEMNNQEVEKYFKKYILPPKGFIYKDILREINLAQSGDSDGKFLTALGLLCYTEFMGAIVLKGKGSYTKQFKAFFRLMGEDYRQLVDEKEVDVYRIFRCGMAHSYFAEDCDIKMVNSNYSVGIVVNRDGKYLFIVEKYFQDFMDACEQVYNDLLIEPEPYLPST